MTTSIKRSENTVVNVKGVQQMTRLPDGSIFLNRIPVGRKKKSWRSGGRRRIQMSAPGLVVMSEQTRIENTMRTIWIEESEDKSQRSIRSVTTPTLSETKTELEKDNPDIESLHKSKQVESETEINQTATTKTPAMSSLQEKVQS